MAGVGFRPTADIHRERDCTNFPREIAEAALAHIVGNAVEQPIGVARLTKRRELMEAWSAFVAGAKG